MVYRIAQASENHLDFGKLTDRLTRLFAPYPFLLRSTAGVRSCKRWTRYHTYCALVGAIDMFFDKFLEHGWQNFVHAHWEVGEKVVRSYFLFQATSDFNPNDLLRNAFTDKLNRNIGAVFHKASKQEMSKKDSYFPYMLELRIVPRTPYSASANPDLFMWCHLIGAFHYKTRSIKVKCVDCKSSLPVFVNAAYVFYYVFKNLTFTRRFFRRKV